MNLGDELRAVLGQEADLQDAGRPDVDRLIMGGLVRRRRRNLTRVGGAALALVLVGGGAYAVAQNDRSESGSTRIADQKTETPEAPGADGPPTLATDPGPGDLEAGTYRIPVGRGLSSRLIEADISLEGPGWRAGDFPVVQDDTSLGGVGVYRPTVLAAGSGCSEDLVTTDLGDGPLGLVHALAKLPRSTVVRPLTPTELLGRDALHLRLHVQPKCEHPHFYRVVETPRGSRGISYTRPDRTFPPVVIDFWVMEVDGVRIVVDSWHQQGAAAGLVDRIASARESITFVPEDS